MIKNATFWTMVITGAGVGFIVGYGIGQETKEVTPNHVNTNVSNGIVTITANVAGALSDGVTNWINKL